MPLRRPRSFLFAKNLGTPALDGEYQHICQKAPLAKQGTDEYLQRISFFDQHWTLVYST